MYNIFVHQHKSNFFIFLQIVLLSGQKRKRVNATIRTPRFSCRSVAMEVCFGVSSVTNTLATASAWTNTPEDTYLAPPSNTACLTVATPKLSVKLKVCKAALTHKN